VPNGDHLPTMQAGGPGNTGGVGARYQLTQKYPMHLRFDYAWGRDGPLFYFSVSEAF
jgi:hypothetical protein